MSDGSVIREFLVALGFKVDEKGLKQFSASVGAATANVGKLVTAITGAALVVGAGVAAFASNLESLYFASQRTGAAAANIKALESTAQDLGASAGEARGSLESIARFMRNNPGGEGFLESLGVNTRKANGDLRDTSDILVDLGRAFQKMPQYQANQYAQFLGISENMELALRSGKFEEEYARKQKLFAKGGFDQATRDAHAFMEQLRQLGQQFDTFGTKVEGSLIQKAGPGLQKFSAWFDAHGQEIADRLGDVLAVFLQLGEEAIPVILQLMDKFIELDKETDGLSSKVIILGGLFFGLGGARILGSMLGVVGGLNKISVAAEGAADKAGLIGKAFKLAGAAALAYEAYQAGHKVGEKIYEHLGDSTKDVIGGTIATALAKLGLGDAQDALDGNEKGWTNKSTPLPKRSLPQKAQAAIGDATQAAVNFFERSGWTHAQAAGVAANFQHESQFNPQAVGDSGLAYGIGQWHPDRQKEFARWAGKDIHGSSLEEQLGFAHYEMTKGAFKTAGDLLRASKTASDAGSVVSRYYERPLDAVGEADRRAASAVQISQKTDIHVHGVGNPQEVAREVINGQSRTNSDMTRNMQTAVS